MDALRVYRAFTKRYGLSQLVAGDVGDRTVRLRRSFSFLQALSRNQVSGTIKTSHGMTATIVVMSDAVLSPKMEPDSRTAFQT
jgi:hypothetical protein